MIPVVIRKGATLWRLRHIGVPLVLWLLHMSAVCSGFTTVVSDPTIHRALTRKNPGGPRGSCHHNELRIPERRRRRTELLYSNPNDPIGYQQDALLPSVDDTVLLSSNSLVAPSRISTTITTLDDFYQVIQECRQQNTLLMVHWSAPWCRSCQRVAPLLHRTIQQVLSLLSKSSPLSATVEVPVVRRQKIRYVNIPLLYSLSTSNHYISSTIGHETSKNQNHGRTNLHAMFDIRTVPYCHIYHPTDGLIDEFAITTAQITPRRRQQQYVTKTIAELRQLLLSYISTNHSD